LKRDEVFEVKRLNTALCIESDFYHGASVAEASDKYPPWRYTNDCAFLKVKIRGDAEDWVALQRFSIADNIG
jgi:hypothetical protein